MPEDPRFLLLRGTHVAASALQYDRRTSNSKYCLHGGLGIIDSDMLASSHFAEARP